MTNQTEVRRAAPITIFTLSLLLSTFAPSAFAQWLGSATPGYIYTASGVGIGTSTPNSSYFLDVNSSFGARVFTNSATGFGGMTVQANTDAVGALLTLGSGRGDVYAGIAAANYTVFLTAGASNNGFIIETFTNKPLVLGANNIERMRIDGSGVVTVTGDMNVSGNIAAKYQDVAEWVPSEHALDAGTVVVLRTDRSNAVETSAIAYDTKIAGVISDRPGLLLGEAGIDKSKVATTGRVKVNVDASKHPIRIGDLLVTSDKPGCAMVSEPVKISGIEMHRPGTIIGKALESMPSGEGQVLVLLSLQ